MKADFLSSKTKLGRTRSALLQLYHEHQEQDTLPTSGRFLYYELIARETLSKESHGDYDLMIAALTDLREREMVPWEDIVDETRRLTEPCVFNSLAEAMKEQWEYTHLDFWNDTPRPLIICESRSLSGILEPLVKEYQASLTSTIGQVSGFLRTKVAPALRDEGQIILYLGDWDFSGGHIERNTQSVLEEAAERSLQWERVAVTERQVKEL